MPKPIVEAPSILTIPDFEFGSEEAERDVVFKPNPGPQTEFLAASEREVLYGGASGGGKSYALLADALRDLPHPNSVGF